MGSCYGNQCSSRYCSLPHKRYHGRLHPQNKIANFNSSINTSSESIDLNQYRSLFLLCLL